ncbi:glutathione S-transferase Mu 2-like [Macrobrachium rosenbergii]|uniref:glutathione S-transferase Mu 2-like n=1 Tax=Macrobrachium rosenbergii TaxID=79674 RepID=UPI0034D5E862
MVPILGYWKIRGLAQPIRYVLEYGGEGYDEKFFEAGPAPDFDKSSWTSVKFTLGLPLPNLPYYIEGDVKLTQSSAILRHLGRKYDLCGKTEKQMMMVDVLMEQGKDMRMAFARLCYMTYSPETKKEYLTNLQTTLKSLSTILGNQSWFAADKITLADFVLYEELYANLVLDPTCLDSFSNLKNFVKRFEDIPAIKKFMSSPKYIKHALNGPMAKFGSGK